jgi:hypothetical protein
MEDSACSLARGEGRQNLDQGSELALSAATGQHQAVAFSLVYVGLCRVLAFVVSCWRRDVDKDVELVVLRLKGPITPTSGLTSSDALGHAARPWPSRSSTSSSAGCSDSPCPPDRRLLEGGRDPRLAPPTGGVPPPGRATTLGRKLNDEAETIERPKLGRVA